MSGRPVPSYGSMLHPDMGWPGAAEEGEGAEGEGEESKQVAEEFVHVY